jgi:hypothetical protein
MFASNFPVDGLVGSFDTIFIGFKAIVADMAENEQGMLFHDNAVRVSARSRLRGARTVGHRACTLPRQHHQRAERLDRRRRSTMPLP